MGSRRRDTIAAVSETVKIGDLAAEAGLRRVHILAWRDLEDVEAGGSEIHADRVASIWARAGIEVTMRTAHASGASQRTRRNGYRVIRRGGRYMVFPRAALAELFGGHGPADALVEVWNGMPFLSPVWARLPRMAWVHHPHTEMWSKVLPRYRAAAGRILERDVAPRLYARTPVVTLSESARARLLRDFGLRSERVHVVPPGVDLRWHSDSGESAASLRGGDSDGREPLLVAVGRLMAYKDFQRVVRVVARLRRQAPPPASSARLTLVGQGPEREQLERLIAELDAQRWCSLAGRLSDGQLAALYRRCSAVVSASISEGWGMTITEAAASGAPAVVSDICGHEDAVIDGVTGHLASGDDDFIVALSRMLNDPSHRRRLGEAAKRRAAGLTWERTAHDTLAVLADEALRRRK